MGTDPAGIVADAVTGRSAARQDPKLASTSASAPVRSSLRPSRNTLFIVTPA